MLRGGEGFAIATAIAIAKGTTNATTATKGTTSEEFLLMFDIHALIANLLVIDPAKFKAGLAKGQKPVKLACKLGADYQAASLIAGLSLSYEAEAINAAYADKSIRSCMTGNEVGSFYTQLGVGILKGDNFRALVVESEGVLYSPRCYGLSLEAVPSLLGANLVVDRQLFAQVLKPVLTYGGEVKPAIFTEREAQFEVTRVVATRFESHFDSYWFAAKVLGKDTTQIRYKDVIEATKTISKYAEKFFAKREVMSYSSLLGLQNQELRFDFVNPVGKSVWINELVVLPHTTKKVKAAKNRRGFVSAVEVKKPKGLCPYLDFPLEFGEVKNIEVAASNPIDVEALGYELEAQYEGYRY